MKIEKSSLEAYQIVRKQLAHKILEYGGVNKDFVNRYFSMIQQSKMGLRLDMDEFEGAILDNGLCGIDCSMFDMSELSQEEFERIPFDTNTVFSEKQILQFHPNDVLERAKSFGLGIDDINTNLTGVHIAIIDQSFDYRTVDAHIVEYVGKDVTEPENEERYHGKTVTSLIASASCGIAKNASVHFFSGIKISDCLGNIVTRNKENIENGKEADCISVISISQRLSNEDFEKYRTQLREVGCELVCSNNYNMDFHSFRNGIDYTDTLLMDEQEIRTSFGTDSEYRLTDDMISMGIERSELGKAAIKIPINRTYHQIGSDPKCYKYQAFDSTSWGIPQVAGLIAVFKKQKKDLTYEEFVDIAKSTSNGNNHIINVKGIQSEISKRLEQTKQSSMKNLVTESLSGNTPATITSVSRADQMSNMLENTANLDINGR